MSQNNKPSVNPSLPSDKMPKCWNQDDRMNALFSPLRSKSANQQDWISKYNFWSDIIYLWLSHTTQCSFSVIELQEVFKRKGCIPVCLTTVVEELVRRREILPKEEFLKEPCDSWATWSMDTFIKRPLMWSYFRLKDYIIGPDTNKETKYVHIKAVKNLAEHVLTTIGNEHEDVLLSVSEILEKYRVQTANFSMSEETLKLALIWLKHSKKAVFQKSSTDTDLLVKISTKVAHEISQVEEALYKLLKQKDKLEKEIELLEKEKADIICKAKMCLKNEMRQTAKAQLKKKLELERTMEKRTKTLINLHTLILNIEDSASNSHVLEAYKTGSAVLKQTRETGLTEYNVREVIDDLSEALEEYKEVQSMLSQTLEDNDSESQEDLEKELEELMKTDLTAEMQQLQDRLTTLNVQDLPSLEISQEIPLDKQSSQKILSQPVPLESSTKRKLMLENR